MVCLPVLLRHLSVQETDSKSRGAQFCEIKLCLPSIQIVSRNEEFLAVLKARSSGPEHRAVDTKLRMKYKAAGIREVDSGGSESDARNMSRFRSFGCCHFRWMEAELAAAFPTGNDVA